jgi:hypothetical protein
MVDIDYSGKACVCIMKGTASPEGIPSQLVKAAAGGLSAVVPLYVVELATEHYFLAHSSVFSFLSSFRLPFFIAYIGVASFVVGWRSKNLILAWASYAVCLAGLYLLFYVGCNPTVCYSKGIDGLEPFRSYSFFLAEGVALLASGYPAQRASRSESLLGSAAAYYALAYYPVMFTVAGAKMLAPLAPFPVLGMLFALTFIISARTLSQGEGWLVGLTLLLVDYLVLSALSIGTAAQYPGEEVSSILMMLAAVVSGGLLGASKLVGGSRNGMRLGTSGIPTVIMIAFLVLSIGVITPDAVVGTAPKLGSSSYYFQVPVVAGGFNAAPNLVTTGVASNFSFQGTDPTSIQPDNFLAAGIGVHSSNCCVDGIDYGYRADVFLYHNGSLAFAASAWEVCDTIIACGGHTWKHLMFFSSARLNSSVAEDFRLSMQWDNGTVLWYYGSHSEEQVLATFQAPRQDNHDFDAGWLGPSTTPSPGGFPFFQFGIMSAYPIGHGGWEVASSCPSTLVGGRWGCLGDVEFFQGDISFWKALWRWGENYPDVGAMVGQGNQTMILHYSTDSFHSFQKAW